jgi:hypothetical protein
MSRIRRIASETESAETNKLATTVPLRGANIPKTDEKRREPENQHDEHWCGYRGGALFVHQPAYLADIQPNTQCLGLKRALLGSGALIAPVAPPKLPAEKRACTRTALANKVEQRGKGQVSTRPVLIRAFVVHQ